MAQGVGRDAAFNPLELARALERRLHAGDGLAYECDDIAPAIIEAFPSTQVREKPWREACCGLALGCLARVVRVAMEDAAIGINPRQARPALPRRIEYRAGTRAGIEPEQKKSAQMTEWPFVCRASFLHFAGAPTDQKQFRELITSKPSLASLAAFGKRNAYETAVETFLGVMVDRCRKILQVTPRPAALPLVRYPARAVV